MMKLLLLLASVATTGAFRAGALRVPQTVMLTAMPPSAAYREHRDSDFGRDNPRKITILLYLANDSPKGGALRVHLPGGSRDIYTHAGRLVGCFAQELLHAVMPSQSEKRFALTRWVWDTKRDEVGR